MVWCCKWPELAHFAMPGPSFCRLGRLDPSLSALITTRRLFGAKPRAIVTTTKLPSPLLNLVVKIRLQVPQSWPVAALQSTTSLSTAPRNLKRVAYFYDSDVGNYAYVAGHPMKPHRI